MQSKREIRAQMRAARRSLDHVERWALASRLARVATYAVLLRRARRFACYLPNDGEMDLTPLMQRLWAFGRESFLPVIHGPRLWFFPFERGTPLGEGRYGIPEPAVSPARRCRISALNVVLMPLVAFDDTGNRLGMGGGYYDQTFSFKRRPRSGCEPLLIGVAYEFQRVERLPRRLWDVPLDGIVTECGLRRFTRGGAR